jgi:hypothetical protein
MDINIFFLKNDILRENNFFVKKQYISFTLPTPPPHFVNNFLSHISDTILISILFMKNLHKFEI